MSLMGIHLLPEDEWEKSEQHHLDRMSIKPDIAGMRQVSGCCDVVDFEEAVEVDTE